MKRFSFLLLFVFVLSIANAQHYKVGIVLSGGGALGFAHIGVLQALDEAGIHPQIVAGCSMGALVGALYANGMEPADIYHLILDNKLDKMSSIIKPKIQRRSLGFSSQKSIKDALETDLCTDNFDSLKMPLYVSVTNLTTGKNEIVGHGKNLIPYVLASAAVPGVFQPVRIDSMIYVDGGVTDNFPALAIRKHCTYLIGSNVNPDGARFEPDNMLDIALRVMRVAVHDNAKLGLKACDFLIQPLANRVYNAADFKNFQAIYDYGYQEGKTYLKAHPEMVRELADK